MTNSIRYLNNNNNALRQHYLQCIHLLAVPPLLPLLLLAVGRLHHQLTHDRHHVVPLWLLRHNPTATLRPDLAFTLLYCLAPLLSSDPPPLYSASVHLLHREGLSIDILPVQARSRCSRGAHLIGV